MGDILKDSRFAKYLNDPRYKPIPKHKRKVKIDKRFQSMFSGDNFKVKYAVDKRGRPVNETSVENLRKYYDLEESDNTDDETEETEKVQKINDESVETFGRFVRRPPSEEPEDEKPHPSTENDKLVRGKLDYKIKQRLQNLDIDYARGQGVLVSGSSSSEEDSTDNEEDGELEHEWGELDADAGTTEDSTKRIAICNMDWDNIKAVDLMVLLNSFIPPGGIIHKISIYPSEYGLKRMQEEEVRGPIELTEKPDEIEQSGDEGHEEGSIYHMEKLRRYQLNRLKYFYAVVECDSVATADKLYSECDGMEYESSATKLDMRFIPDDIKFDQVPREVCTKLPDLTKYKPRLFTTTALQHAKVELTWDATNPNRTQAIRSALDGKIDDLDLKDYLASSSEDENPDDEDSATILDKDSEDPIHKYKSLLEEIESKEENKKNKDMELEITWGLGIKDRAEELVKKKLNEEAKDLTPFEKLMKKRKEKKKERKLKIKQEEEHENKLDVGNSSSDEVPSDIDLNDPYFVEEFNKPEFKKAKKLSKKSNESEDGVEEEKRKAELKLLLDDEDDNKAHFSLKKIQEAESSTKKSKRKKILNEKMKKQKQEQKQALPDFEINLNDNRFSAIYNSHLYNIDPTNPNFKKTKNMEKLIEEKLRRRPVDTPVEEVHVQSKKSKQDAELSLLVKNIKRKTKHDVKK